MAKGKQQSQPQETDGQMAAASKIDKIKELIFGENIVQYNDQFESLKRDIAAKKQELEQLIDEMNTAVHTALDNSATDLGIRITELQDSVEARMDQITEDHIDKRSLGKLLVELGNRISE